MNPDPKTLEELLAIIDAPGFADLRAGGTMPDLLWVRDVAVPCLVAVIAERDAMILDLRAALAREGEHNG